jgi:hypothetical protein
MRDQKMTAGLLCTWIPVTDMAGRTHMEARWLDPAATPAGTTHVHAA